MLASNVYILALCTASSLNIVYSKHAVYLSEPSIPLATRHNSCIVVGLAYWFVPGLDLHFGQDHNVEGVDSFS
jgi:hypothetical protein